MGGHEYGRKPHPQWIIVSSSLALVAMAFVGAAFVSDSEVTKPGMTYTFPKPSSLSESPVEPRPTETVTKYQQCPRAIEPAPTMIRRIPGPRVTVVQRKTVTASPKPAPTVTKTVRPSPVPGPTVTVTETVTAAPTQETP